MLIKFSLNVIPSDAVISKAEVIMHTIPLGESAFFYREDTSYCRQSTLSMHRVTKTWQEDEMDSAVTQWAPYEEAYENIASAQCTYTSDFEMTRFDITNDIVAMHKGNLENKGFVILTDYRYNYADGSGGSMVYWHSKQTEVDSLSPILRVVYEGDEVDLFELTVTEGSGSGYYIAGDIITITAKDSSDYRFLKWEGDTEFLTNINESTTTVTMPEVGVAVKACYVKDSVSQLKSSGQPTQKSYIRGNTLYTYSLGSKVALLNAYSLQGRKLYEEKVLLSAGMNSISLPLYIEKCYILGFVLGEKEDWIKVVNQH